MTGRRIPPLATIDATTPLDQLPAFLTTSQAAAYLQLDRRTVAIWCSTGTLTAAKLGTSQRGADWRIPREEIARQLATG
jgi:excisionase family DNA binding protein